VLLDSNQNRKNLADLNNDIFFNVKHIKMIDSALNLNLRYFPRSRMLQFMFLPFENIFETIKITTSLKIVSLDLNQNRQNLGDLNNDIFSMLTTSR